MRMYAAFFLCVAAAATASAQPLSTARTDHTTVPGPRAIAVADFNRDGWLDIASAGTGRTVSVLLNRGREGSGFRRGPEIVVGGGPFDMAAGDVNRDGIVDLAIANADLDAVTLLLGRGDGSFAPKRDVAVEGNPRGIALADIDGDAKLDILVTQYTRGSWRLLYGDGEGGIARATTVSTHAQPQGIAAADLSRDGRLDVVVAHAGPGPLSAFVRSGGGSWTRLDVSRSRGPHHVLTVGDFNRDGWADVATASTSGNVVTIFTGEADGLQERCSFPTGASPRGIVARDLNRDGVLDLITGNRTSSTISVFLGRAGLVCAFEGAEIAAGRGARDVAAADFDNDGRLDLASANEYGNSVSVLHNVTPFVRAGYVFSSIALLGRREGPVGFETTVAADFDRSGMLDVAVVERQEFEGFRVSFDGTRTVNVRSNGANDLASADFNNDGNPDVVVMNSWPVGVLRVHLGDGRGNFRELPAIPGPPAAISATADFNRDGRLDLVAPEIDGDAQTAVIRVLAGRGDGTFTVVKRGTPPAVRPLTAFAAADVNRDGRPDLVTASGASVTIMYGDGAGSWTRAAEYEAQDFQIEALAVADVNEDGRPDVIAAGGTHKVVVFATLPDGSFDRAADHAAVADPSGFPVYTIGVGDIDLDGHLDIVTNGGDILFGAGDGTFELAAFEEVAWRPTVADYNLDGLPDVIAGHTNGAVVMLNQRTDRNRNPIANAGPDLTIPSRDDWDVELEARASSDPDLHELTYEWHGQDDRIATGPIFAVPRLAPGSRYSVTLLVFDGRGGQGSDTVVITVPSLTEIVMHASGFQPLGAWRHVEDDTAAGGIRVHHPDAGDLKLARPATAPAHVLEWFFHANPNLEYKLWIRGKADGNHWGNDSVFVQFLGAEAADGTGLYELGTTSALTVNLEECIGCGLDGWGWEDDGWGAKDRSGVLLRFPHGFAHIFIQTREDGLSIDQIVLSAEKWLTMRPGQAKRDRTILPTVP